MAEHDASYKLLFSRPCMVEDLLRGFVRARCIDELDFSTLEKLSGNCISDDLRARENDVIWRVRWSRKEAWLYVYLLIEFQSYPEEEIRRLRTWLPGPEDGALRQDFVL